MWIIFKVFICYNIVSVLCLGFFGHKACGILASWPEIEPAPPALESEILITGLPGKFKSLFFPKLFLPHYLSLFLLGLWWYDCWILCYFPTHLWGSIHFYPYIFSLMFRLAESYWCIFKFTDSILCNLHSTIELIQWVIFFSALYFSNL